jgi:maleate cis-trans isomerase
MEENLLTSRQGNLLSSQVGPIPVVGFISAPAFFDPSPHEFKTAVKEEVLTQQAFPLLPNFDYSLDSIASEQLAERFCLCAESLQAAKCDLLVQVGSPFAWANVNSETEARQRNERIMKAANIPSIMTSLAIIDALRSHKVHKIAITSTYYSSIWSNCFANFVSMCGFEVLHTSNFYEQQLVKTINKNEHFKYTDSEMPNMVKASVQFVKAADPDSQAIVIVGTGAKTLNILCELEVMANCPVIPADTVVYWLIAQSLNLTLLPNMGRFRDLFSK